MLLLGFTRRLLSGSTSGRPIPVAATATPGTTIHTAVTGATSFDEIYAWANNRTGADVTLTTEWGGTANGDHTVETFKIPANSAPYPIATGQVLNGGLTFAAFCSTASAINITGYVNRITP